MAIRVLHTHACRDEEAALLLVDGVAEWRRLDKAFVVGDSYQLPTYQCPWCAAVWHSNLPSAMGQSGCVVAYYGTVIALAGAQIRASEDRPYPVAVDSQGRFVPASWGDFVVGMAKSDALADGPVTVEIRLPRPEEAL